MADWAVSNSSLGRKVNNSSFVYSYIFLKIWLVLLMCASVFPACIYVHHMRAWCVGKKKGTSDPLGTIVTDGCEPSFRAQEPNLGPQQHQPVILTIEPSLLPHFISRSSIPLVYLFLHQYQAVFITIAL